ncbi:MAG: hypothetical protein Fur0043_27030 [Anaerolineales bacterium]
MAGWRGSPPGCSLRPAAPGGAGSLGLRQMRERVEALGGPGVYAESCVNSYREIMKTNVTTYHFTGAAQLLRLRLPHLVQKHR